MNLVDAVKTPEEVAKIAHKLMLNARGNPLYADLWNFGLQMALRISDLLTITMDQACSNRVVLVEQKTGKSRSIKLNEKALAIAQERRAANPSHFYLFEVESNRAKGKAVSRVAVGKAFKAVGDELGIALGTHSMRKTRGWVMHKHGKPIELICKVLNHSSPALTMLYLGITQEEIDDTYDEFVI